MYMVFCFLVCYASTLLTLLARQERIKPVCSNMVVRRIPTLWHSRNGFRVICIHRKAKMRNRTKHTRV